ncbi:MAG TPA: hypothetical protein ENJ08_01995 [Gammaproteobacteria bacterium]|nr:hypothetical protein [Gammaproteobacteria bacterium]
MYSHFFTCRLILLLSAIFLISSCSPQFNLKTVDRTSDSRTLMGLFTFKLPEGDNWYDLKSSPTSMSFSKAVEAKDASLTAAVYVKKTEHSFSSEKQFLNAIKSSRARNVVPANFNLLKHDENIDATLGPFCTKYAVKVNRRERERSNGVDRQLIERRGFTCLHPKRADLIITIEYTTHSRFNYVRREILLEGENFIRSLIFL